MAAKEGVAFKKGLWAKEGIAPADRLAASLVTFVLEDGGRLSQPALEFIDVIYGLDKVVLGGADYFLAAERRVLLAHIQTIIALSLVRLVRLFRAHWIPMPGEVLLRVEPSIAVNAPPPTVRASTPGRQGEGECTAAPSTHQSVQHQNSTGRRPRAADWMGEEEEPIDTGCESAYIQSEEVVFSRRYAALGTDAVVSFEESPEKCACKVCHARPSEGAGEESICANARRYLECDERSCGAGQATCENRRLQSLDPSVVQVAEVPSAARRGVRAVGALQEGACVGEFVGKLTAREDIAVPDCSPFAPIVVFAHAREQTGAERMTPTVIDARRVGNGTRFLSPSCTPNCKASVWWVHGLPRLVIETIRAIKEGEFLTLSHSTLQWDKRWCGECRKAKTRGSRGPLVGYTDGSWRAREKDAAAGWAAVIVERLDSLQEDAANKELGTIVEEMWGAVDVRTNSPFFGGAQVHTNNTGELTAIWETLLWFKHYSDRNELIIYTDCALAITFASGKSTPDESGPLFQIWENIRALLDEMKGHVFLFKVPAHLSKDKILFNERADFLAKAGGDGESASTVGRYSSFAEPTPDRRFEPPPPSASASPNATPPVSPVRAKVVRERKAKSQGGRGRGGGGSGEGARAQAHPPRMEMGELAARAAIGAVKGPPQGSNQWSGRSADGLVSATLHFDVEKDSRGVVWVDAEEMTTWLQSPGAQAIAAAFRCADPQLALLDAMEKGLPALQVELSRRMQPSDLASGTGSTYSSNKGDGLCAYRAAYQVYRFYKIGHLTDVDLSNEAEAEAFAKWIEESAQAGCAVAGSESVIEKARIAVSWIRARNFSHMFQGIKTKESDRFGWGGSSEVLQLLRGAERNEPGLSLKVQILQQAFGRGAELEPSEDCVYAQWYTYDQLLAHSAGPKLYIYFDANHFWFARPVQTEKDAGGPQTDDMARITGAVKAAVEDFVASIQRKVGNEQAVAPGGRKNRGEVAERVGRPAEKSGKQPTARVDAVTVTCSICEGKSMLKTSYSTHLKSKSHLRNCKNVGMTDKARSVDEAGESDVGAREALGPQAGICGSCEARTSGAVQEAGLEGKCCKPGCFKEVGDAAQFFQCDGCKGRLCWQCAQQNILIGSPGREGALSGVE